MFNYTTNILASIVHAKHEEKTKQKTVVFVNKTYF